MAKENTTFLKALGGKGVEQTHPVQSGGIASTLREKGSANNMALCHSLITSTLNCKLKESHTVVMPHGQTKGCSALHQLPHSGLVVISVRSSRVALGGTHCNNLAKK